MRGSLNLLNTFLLRQFKNKSKVFVFKIFLFNYYYQVLFGIKNLNLVYFFLIKLVNFLFKKVFYFRVSYLNIYLKLFYLKSIFIFYLLYFFEFSVLFFKDNYLNLSFLKVFLKYDEFFVLSRLILSNINRYSVILRFVKNNIHLTLVDSFGKVFFKLSSGKLGYKKGKDRRTTLALKSIFLFFFSYIEKELLLKNKKTNVLLDLFDTLYLKDIPNNCYSIIFNNLNKELGLNNFKFTFCFVSLLNRAGHGYIRSRKLRRL